MMPCPTCGHPLPDNQDIRFDPMTGVVIANGKMVVLSKRQAEIFGVIYDTYPAPATLDKIMTRVYGHLEDPPYDKTVSVHICLINNRIAPLEISIHNRYHVGWRLEHGPRKKIVKNGSVTEHDIQALKTMLSSGWSTKDCAMALGREIQWCQQIIIRHNLRRRPDLQTSLSSLANKYV